MNRSSRAEQLQAELFLMENEDAFALKKADGTLSKDDKLALRALRQEYREKYRPANPNGATAGTIKAGKGEN